jgi:signal transduction histidine kinase
VNNPALPGKGPGTSEPDKAGGTHAPPGWNLGLRREALGNLAHELRTPIQVAIGYLDILQDDYRDQLSKEVRDIVERTSANVHDLAQTIDNLMEFMLSEAEAMPSLQEEVGVRGLIAELAPAMDAANLKKRLELRFEVEGAPETIRAPRRMLRSIILNLVLNAIKFTESGGVTIRLRQTHDTGAADALEIEVSDTGPGIDPAMLETAIEPFAQLSASNARRYRGVGLGLTIVQRNVAALGGKLELRPGAGHGTTLLVRIPVKRGPATRRGRRASVPVQIPPVMQGPAGKPTAPFRR